MELIMILLLSTCLVAFTIAVILTPLIRKFALKYGINAKTNHRTVHHGDIPKLGGLAIYAAYLAGFGMIMLFSHGSLEPLIRESIVFLIGGTLIVLLGIFDDIKGANCYHKFSIQLLAASIVVFSGYKMAAIVNPFGGVISLGYFSIPFTLLWIVGITNAINLIDGLDGLAAGISLGASIIMIVVSLWFGNIASAFPAAILAGSLTAFLFFNFNPAKIFLGDTGSLFIGFMLACFSINGTFREASAISILIPVIVLGIPIADTTLAILRRMRNGVHPFQADREHIHHRLLNLGLSHRQVVLLMNGVSYFWGAIACVIIISRYQYSLLLLIIILGMIIFGLRKLGFLQYILLNGRNNT